MLLNHEDCVNSSLYWWEASLPWWFWQSYPCSRPGSLGCYFSPFWLAYCCCRRRVLCSMHYEPLSNESGLSMTGCWGSVSSANCSSPHHRMIHQCIRQWKKEVQRYEKYDRFDPFMIWALSVCALCEAGHWKSTIQNSKMLPTSKCLCRMWCSGTCIVFEFEKSYKSPFISVDDWLVCEGSNLLHPIVNLSRISQRERWERGGLRHNDSQRLPPSSKVQRAVLMIYLSIMPLIKHT